MSKDLIFNFVLVILAIILMVLYAIYVIIDERKKWNMREFFKYKIYYEADYYLYIDMVKKMKKVLFKKKLELVCFKKFYKIKPFEKTREGCLHSEEDNQYKIVFLNKISIKYCIFSYSMIKYLIVLDNYRSDNNEHRRTSRINIQTIKTNKL